MLAGLSLSALKPRFLAAMSRGVNMVNIVTTDGGAGRSGATVSAMASVSADTVPPTLLICMNREGTTAQAVIKNGVFCLNVLEAGQTFVADCFAGRIQSEGGDRFACATWSRGVAGAWRLDGAVASFDCRVLKADLVGTHYVIIGSTEAAEVCATGRALLHSAREYCSAAPLPAATVEAR